RLPRSELPSQVLGREDLLGGPPQRRELVEDVRHDKPCLLIGMRRRLPAGGWEAEEISAAHRGGAAQAAPSASKSGNDFSCSSWLLCAMRRISSNASTFPIASLTGLWSWAVLLNRFQPCVSLQFRLRPAQKSLIRRS